MSLPQNAETVPAQGNLYTALLQNRVLTNLLFMLVVGIGTASYMLMPREQDPSINFNWIQITTILPGASARDVERKVTEVLEEGLETVADIKFVSSNSRENVSMILVRFVDIDVRTFDKRIADVRRVVQNREELLPEDAEDPDIYELTSSNAFPSAVILVTAENDDHTLHRRSRTFKRELERLPAVDRVLSTGLNDPEIRVRFYPYRLQAHGISVAQLRTTLQQALKDVSAGDLVQGEQTWLVRSTGSSADPDVIAAIPVSGARGPVPLSELASVSRARAEAGELVRYNGRPTVMLAVMKKERANTLRLVEDLKAYIVERNRIADALGVQLVMADDQTQVTRDALAVMRNNFFLGLALVLFSTALFLGLRIAVLVTIGIPLVLAGTFWILSISGFTVNTSVLLGVVIVLGMLVDDAVVVVESIHFFLQRGVDYVAACRRGVAEVFAPVTASVLTTVAAFLPLMLMPGILGQFMRVIPLVVVTALLISLVEAYWILPSHVGMVRTGPTRSAAYRLRTRAIDRLRRFYGRTLLVALRHPCILLLAVASLVALTGTSAWFKLERDFFAADPVRLFYVNVEMEPASPLELTLQKVLEVERALKAGLRPGEARSVYSYAGQLLTETAPFWGAQYGQVQVSLYPEQEGVRSVDELLESLRPAVERVGGARRITFLRLSGGPPAGKPISVKVMGNGYEEVRAAADELLTYMRADDHFRDVIDDDTPGTYGLDLRLDYDAVRRAGLTPDDVTVTLAALVDGVIATTVRSGSEEVEVRLKGVLDDERQGLDRILDFTIPLPGGGAVPLVELADPVATIVKGNIRRYNFRRAVTVESDLDKTRMDTAQANATLREHWRSVAGRHPGVGLEFSGELDDIQESLDAIVVLFAIGIGIMYLILGAQFRSYFQPFLILAAVPMAFTGVAIGLLISGYPLSLFNLYGIVALAGIAVNAAIVMIDKINRNANSGMRTAPAVFFAARRRLVPILITAMTTIAGLFSLAVGLGGHSLIWSPVATVLVWGLLCSTALSIYTIPVLYLCCGRGRASPHPAGHERLAAP